MPDTSANNKRIAKNTAFLYVRMLISLVVTLFTSRVVLNALGVTDFGIYNVVGGIVLMLGFFQSSLSNVAQRFITIALGNNDILSAEHAYRQSFSIMLFFSFVVLVAGETLGLWFVENRLVIPPNRMSVTFWIYQLSLLSVIFSLNSITPIAAIVSHEKMSFYAYLGLFESFSKLGIAYILLVTNQDRLIVYGILMTFVTIISFLVYFVYCTFKFQECRPKWYYNHPLVKKMSGFISYNLFGCLAYSGAEQGITILLNMFFGPVVNAARGVSSQVVHSVTRFSENIITAFKPQIIKSYTANDFGYMYMLIEKSSKFSYFFSAVLTFPIIANIQEILNLWLGNVPIYSVEFTIIVLIQSLIGTLIPPLWIAANATGVIKYNQVYGRFITLMTLPLSYVTLLYFKTPIIPLLWLVITQIGYWVYCIYDMRKQICLDILRYFRKVVVPCLILSILMVVIILIISPLFMKSGFWFVISTIFYVFIGIAISYSLLEKTEKSVLIDFVKKKMGIHLQEN